MDPQLIHLYHQGKWEETEKASGDIHHSRWAFYKVQRKEDWKSTLWLMKLLFSMYAPQNWIHPEDKQIKHDYFQVLKFKGLNSSKTKVPIPFLVACDTIFN
jgi:hypothetical protein